jgi:uroporphyrin-III C-methyltransferase/precorrin-2 dehydrogenase/sirohydrochlorin ferrochelatase
VDFLPVSLNIRNRNCLVVGGGLVAARKAAMLHSAGASIYVVAATLCAEVHELVDKNIYQHINRDFQENDLLDKALVIAATNERAINEQVSKLAKSRSLPVNVVDNPDLCSFIMPSIIDRSPLQVAISTGGASPVLARMLRTQLESSIPTSYGKLAALVEGYRDQVKSTFDTVEQRRSFWEDILEGPVAELVFAGKESEAHQRLQKAIDEAKAKPNYQGEVYLVGAGPGDPDLLTFRALRLMQKADVVVYDRLVSDPIMDLVRRDAEKHYVGKERDKHAVQQEDINQCLVRLAREGKRVLRLKGGDPFVFGRGGEEISTLMDEGVNFQVVPGITAAAGCAAYSGIPLTHRDFAQAVIFVTGHLKDGTVNLNWEMLAHEHQTVVFYMGLHGVHCICEKLTEHGRSGSTPVALVERGTTPQQKVYIGTLNSLPKMVKDNDVKPPTLIIVGEVVKMHEKLRWFMLDREIK